MKRLFSISPGEIADHFREDSIEPNEFIPARIRLGVLIHRREQTRHVGWEAEHFLKYTYTSPTGNRLLIVGRADLVRRRSDNIEVIEIKSLALNPSVFGSLVSPPRSFVVQTQIYAFLLRQIYNVPACNIAAKVLCVNIADDAVREFELSLSPVEVEQIFESFIAKKRSSEAARLIDFRRRRNIARRIRFPFSAIRPVQLTISETIDKVFDDGGDALIEAPPGSGKTLAALIPALKASLGKGCQLFYATAKSGGRSPVRKASEQILSLSPNLTIAFLASQKEICSAGQKGSLICRACSGVYPEDLEVVSENPPQPITGGIYDTGRFVRLAEEQGLCPVLVARSIAARADMLVGDYNFLFDQGARLGAFQGDRPLKWYLAGDEAHNLPERMRDNLSVEIKLADLTNKWETVSDDLWRFNDLSATDGFRDAYVDFIEWVESQLSGANPAGLTEAEFSASELAALNEAFSTAVGRFLAAVGKRLNSEASDSLLDIYRSVSNLAYLVSLDRRRFIHYIDGTSGSIGVKCLDASEEIAETLNRLQGFVLFSGTFNPVSQYRLEIGRTSRPYVELSVSSEVANSNRLLILHASGINTYRKLRLNTAHKVARTIAKFSSLAPGSILAVFPSYEYLSQISIILESPERTILVQRSNMSPSERAEFKRELANARRPTIGMVVAGGQFSEAEDYPGEACVGVVIVGPCLPPPDPWREALTAYWFDRGENGAAIAYLIPAVRKVIQAAGRLIRNESDRGIILLLDDRFIKEPILPLLPASWQTAISGQDERWDIPTARFWKKRKDF